MTYYELKRIQSEIQRLKAKIETLRESAESTTQTLSDMPAGGGTSDKVGDTVIKIKDLSDKVDTLYRRFYSALDSLPESLEAHCIVLKVKRKYSWVKIAYIVGGGNTADGIRKRCHRYFW